MTSKAEVISWKAESSRLEGQEKAAADRKIICLNLCNGQVHTHTHQFPPSISLSILTNISRLLDGLFTREKKICK